MASKAKPVKKKGAAPKAKPASPAKPDDGVSQSPVQNSALVADNTLYMQDVYADMAVVFEKFPDLKREEALGLGDQKHKPRLPQDSQKSK